MPSFSHIPTSFAPLPPQSPLKRHKHLDFVGAFSFVIFGIFVLVSLMTLGVFLYQMYLQHDLVRLQQNTQVTQRSFNTTSIQKMTTLNKRIIITQNLLDTHTTPSSFLDELSADTPKNVRFTSLKATINQSNDTALIKADGRARDFNALVVESRTLEGNKNFSDVIFSNISVDKQTGYINFVVSATASKDLIGNFSSMVSGSETATTSKAVASTTPISSSHATTTTP